MKKIGKEIEAFMIKLYILKTLNKRSNYPYAMYKNLENIIKKKVKLDDELLIRLKDDFYNNIKLLEEKNYIKRKNSKNNKTFYSITKKGKEVLSDIKSSIKRYIDELNELIGV